MKHRMTMAFAVALAAGAAAIGAQQPPAPPPPAFAASNLTEKGVRSMAANCAMCHGTGGKVVPGSTLGPLAGRPASELVEIVKQFKAGTRPATIMHQIAKGYGDAEIAAIAAYFASQPR